MAVLDYQKSPAAAVREMVEMYGRMANDDRKQAAALIERALRHDEEQRKWLAAALKLEETP